MLSNGSDHVQILNPLHDAVSCKRSASNPLITSLGRWTSVVCKDGAELLQLLPAITIPLRTISNPVRLIVYQAVRLDVARHRRAALECCCIELPKTDLGKLSICKFRTCYDPWICLNGHTRCCYFPFIIVELQVAILTRFSCCIGCAVLLLGSLWVHYDYRRRVAL